MIDIVEVSKIYFMDDSISSYFHDGTLITEKNPEDIKMITVFHDIKNNKYWTSNNRSLYVLKKHSMSSIHCEIKMKHEHEKEFNELLNTKTEGRTINVVENAGKWEKEYFLLKSKFPMKMTITMTDWINMKKNRKKQSSIEKFEDSNQTEILKDINHNEDDLIKTLPVSQIYFLQERISSSFNDGTPIDKKDPRHIESIEVIYDEENKKYWSINNRSLYVLKKNNIKTVKCIVKLKRNNEKLFNERHSSKNNGLSVNVLKIYEKNQEEYDDLLKNDSDFKIDQNDWMKHKLLAKTHLKTQIKSVSFDFNTTSALPDNKEISFMSRKRNRSGDK